MSKYLKLFETTSQYEAYMGGGEKILPNVSLIEETNKVEYNPYIPPRNDIIIYTASEKLNVTWSDETATFGATIKSHTFENGVGTIEFNGNVTKITSTDPYPNGAFSNCTNLTSVTIPNSVTSIGKYAFYGCSNLTSITIPNSVTSIGNQAFFDCSSLASITIPSSVTSIDGGSFSNCTSLPVVDNIRYADTCAVEAVDKTLSTYILKEDTRFVASTFYECTNLTSITIPNSVISISSYAFFDCISLASITIPSSVTSIDGNVFQGCTNLKNITIPNSVTTIGGHAFYDCSSLTSVTIPDSVTSIGKNAFYGCSSLINVTVEATTPPTLEYRYGDYGQFDNNASGRKIYVPSASVEIYKSASGWSTYASDIEAIQQ